MYFPRIIIRLLSFPSLAGPQRWKVGPGESLIVPVSRLGPGQTMALRPESLPEPTESSDVVRARGHTGYRWVVRGMKVPMA